MKKNDLDTKTLTEMKGRMERDLLSLIDTKGVDPTENDCLREARLDLRSVIYGLGNLLSCLIGRSGDHGEE